MHIFVNGQETDCPDGCTVAALLDARAVPATGTAVARNEAVVRKAAYADTVLQPGDRIEIIHAVAGG
jgi:sulfur carrier protein